MAKEEELNMDLFSDEPVVEITGDENIEGLFTEGEEIDSEEEVDNQNDEEINTDENLSDNEDSEKVVGKDNEEDSEDDGSADDSDADDSSSNPNLFNSLAKLLVDKGLLSSDDSDLDISSEDEFVETFNKQIEKQIDHKLKEQFGDNAEYIKKGIPIEKVQQNQETLDRLDSINEDLIKEDSNLRQRIIYQDLINKGFSEERAKKNLQRSIELEEDVDDAIDSLNSIKEFNKSRIDSEYQAQIKSAEELQKAEEERLESIKKRISETDEIIKNFKITDSVKEKVQKNMFDVVGEDPVTKTKENSLMKYRRENKEDFDHKLYYLFTITDGFKNFDSIVKNTNSKVIKDLEKAVKSSTKIQDPGSPAYLQDPNSYAIDIAGHEVVVE